MLYFLNDLRQKILYIRAKKEAENNNNVGNKE